MDSDRNLLQIHKYLWTVHSKLPGKVPPSALLTLFEVNAHWPDSRFTDSDVSTSFLTSLNPDSFDKWNSPDSTGVFSTNDITLNTFFMTYCICCWRGNFSVPGWQTHADYHAQKARCSLGASPPYCGVTQKEKETAPFRLSAHLYLKFVWFSIIPWKQKSWTKHFNSHYSFSWWLMSSSLRHTSSIL